MADPLEPVYTWTRACDSNGGSCAEYVFVEDGVMFRGSEHPDEIAMLSVEEWYAFIAAVRGGTV